MSYRILKVVCDGLRLARNFDFKELAKKTRGFVGRDLSALAQSASVGASRRACKAIQTPAVAREPLEGPSVSRLGDPVTPLRASPSSIQFSDIGYSDPLTRIQQDLVSPTISDFLTALVEIKPICKRAGWAIAPDVMWADVGGIGSLLLAEMRMAIVQPIKNPDLLASVGISIPTGTLLWGPPGCGKTLLAKAAAHESGANMITIWGPELLHKVRILILANVFYTIASTQHSELSSS